MPPSRAGIRPIDTSPMYGASERLLAGALDGERGQVVIADKVWTPSPEEGRPSSPARSNGMAAGST